MTAETHAMLTLWLTEGTAEQQQHARNRLAIGDEIEPAYPSVATMAVNAVKAAVGFVASGGATVDQAEHDRRRLVCSTCEHLDAAADRCRQCGCYLAVKPWMAREHCPVGKWGAILGR